MSGSGSERLSVPDDSSTSSDLLLRAAEGDHLAWQQLLDQYRRLILSWCFAVGLQPVDAEDVFQEVWTAIFRNLPKFERRRRGAFRRWLYSVTQSKLADYFRSLKMRAAALGGTDFQAVLQQVAEAQPLSESGAENPTTVPARQLAVLAAEAVRQQVDETTWDAFLATEIEKRAAKDVAADLGVSVNVVYIARSRCKQRLLTELERLRHEADPGAKDSSVH